MSSFGASGRRAAAVIVPIFSEPPHGVLFVERAAHLRSHPGQIGFPGGALDPQDESDLRRAALRELEEEVGIAAERVSFVGELPVVSPRVNRYDVTPFVAVVAPGELRIDPSETAGVFTVPLRTILGGALHDGRVNVGGFEISTPVLDHDGRRIWGMTGRVLQHFVEAWQADGSGLRDRIERLLS